MAFMDEKGREIWKGGQELQYVHYGYLKSQEPHSWPYLIMPALCAALTCLVTKKLGA